MRRAFDVFGNLRSVSESTGSWPIGQPNPTWGSEYRTRYTYDVAGRLLTVQDHASNQTTLTYDLLGRKTSMNDPDMGAWSYTYDTVGNLQTQTDARNTVLWFGYDGLNRLTQKRLTNGNGTLLASYTYDDTGSGNKGKGRRTGMSDGSGSASWTYDARGRVTQESKAINGTGGGTFVTQWGYDSADRPVWMKYPGGSASQIGEQVHYAYTTQGLLNTVRSNGSTYYVGKTQYNERGQVTERWLGSTTGVVKQLYAYTAAENFRLVTLKAGNASPYTNLQNISYTYDDVGNVLTIADAAAYGGSQAQSFSYDTLDRLSTAQASGSTTYGGYTQRSYAYSNAGNITSFEGAALTYNATAHKHAVTHIGGVQKYWYDANGNATRRINGSQDITLTYNAENRLTGMSGGVTSSYVYDADGNRVKETIAGVTRVFVGNTYEVDNGTVKKYYYAGATRVAESSGGVLYYLLTDHLGSTALTLDSSGARVTELRYYPYGGVRYNPGGQVTTYRFTGQRWDSGTALYIYQSRWYDPAVGRFLAADTIVPQPKNPQNLNRYSYVGNQPLRFSDPSGHRPECGVQGGECSNDTYYAGFSVLDRRPWVQAYLADAMDGRHFGEIILAGIIGNAIGSIIGQAIGDLLGIGVPQIQVGRGQSSFRASDAIGDPGFGPAGPPAAGSWISQFDIEQGFSGVYDPDTGTFLLYPSSDALTLSEGWVSQYGGHATVNQKLTQLNPTVRPNRTVAFTAINKGSGELEVRWNSYSVNRQNWGERAAPTIFRQPIVDALRSWTGLKVTGQ